MEPILEKQNHINSLVMLVNANPQHAAEILADQNREVSVCLRYQLVANFNATRELGFIRPVDIPLEIMQIARCWCCTKPLSECLTLKEENYTWIKGESDPYTMERGLAAGLVQYDEKHRRLYIPLCGSNNYDD